MVSSTVLKTKEVAHWLSVEFFPLKQERIKIQDLFFGSFESESYLSAPERFDKIRGTMWLSFSSTTVVRPLKEFIVYRLRVF